MEGSRKDVGRSRLARRPGLEPLEARLQLSTTAPFPTSGPLNGWLFKLVSAKDQPAPTVAGEKFSGTTIQPGSISDRAQAVFAEPVIDANGNAAGEALFRTRFGPRTTARFLAQTQPPLSPVVRTGQVVNGATLGTTIGPSTINNGGQIAFSAKLSGTPAGNQGGGVYVYQPGRKFLNAIALPQDVLPDGSTFIGPRSAPSFSNQGQVAFTAYTKLTKPVGLNGASEGTGVFLANGLKRISKVAAPGDVLSDNSKLDYAADVSVTDTRNLAFIGHRAGDPAFTDPADSTRLLGGTLFYARPGFDIAAVASQGQKLPASQGGWTISYATDPLANNRGQVAFHGALKDDGTAVGVFQTAAGGGVSKVAAPGDVLPDGSIFVTAATGSGSLDFNDRGDLAFLATTNQGQGIYLAKAGTIQLVAKTGDVIPALGLGTIQSFTQPGHTAGPAINSDTQILFAVQTSEGGAALLSATSYRMITRRAGK